MERARDPLRDDVPANADEPREQEHTLAPMMAPIHGLPEGQAFENVEAVWEAPAGTGERRE